ncbi:alpha/beta fold hydrolase [Actinoplanes sp. TRM 88003]|uniref:Alpha/beta fold hydrolase n=1 Tax=Paractinoplanes aksuensis TaxID=2939490 RepID=A0ABT1DGB6_9ACTN|nr:alpha/beta fold hydrolase [Actinoplanes aksuensis]MCO8269095.1 alpha/beta fold hydrolase [Actinoplanes aksuensis]
MYASTTAPHPSESAPTGHAHVDNRGPGERLTLVLLHDSPGSAAALAPLAMRLAETHRVVTIDLPGHGGTTVPADPVNPAATAARTVTEVLHKLGLSEAPIAGLGYGARVLAHMNGPNRMVTRGTTPATAPVPPPGVGHLIDTWWRVRHQTHPSEQLNPADLNEVFTDVLGQPTFSPPSAPFDLDGAIELPEWSAPAIQSAAAGAAVGAAADGGIAYRLSIVDNRVGEIDYRFVNGVPLHFRTAGWGRAGRPLVVLPPAPGSSTKVAALVEQLGRHRPVLAVDYPGHGRSAPLEPAQNHDRPAPPGSVHNHNRPAPLGSVLGPGAERESILDCGTDGTAGSGFGHVAVTPEAYADRVEALVAELGLGDVDVYGSHSGALIGLLWQRRHPGRVRGLVLDGLPLGSSFAHLDLDEYLPDLTPDRDGQHVLRAWAMGHTRENATAWTADLLRGAATYDVLYRAVLTYAVEEQPGGPPTPTLLLRTAGDKLARDVERVHELLPHARVADTTPETTAAVVEQFLTLVGSPL